MPTVSPKLALGKGAGDGEQVVRRGDRVEVENK